MEVEVIYPKSKIPVDEDLYKWAYENYGNSIALTISKYKKEFYKKHNNKKAFIDTK